MNLTLLKKIGTILLKVTEIVTGFGPLISSTVTQAGPVIKEIQADLVAIAQIILQVEAFGQVLNTPGADKLRAATPMVAQAILQSSLLVHHKIDNPVLFQQGSQKIADGMADILNSLKADIETESKT